MFDSYVITDTIILLLLTSFLFRNDVKYVTKKIMKRERERFFFIYILSLSELDTIPEMCFNCKVRTLEISLYSENQR